ncbi:putative nuclease HARBI1 [Anthonomus grandis grandis]|uniref:putative nuclease HARBI1 n=1 Tax=Anthonomus grandis grandis TaxID=2921223 RepID=UPI00216612B3|nr:putative nuclease HARBI1 [Anthonomus grandis grandis]XP_050298759.1 putative nuclease HARBI1 [Anthonomus grandis grandis]XP_050298760.1 putative nuclease HARBI1 [Anthonomus grandis grandis]
MALVNANYEFIHVNVRVSDGGVFENSSFYKKLMEDKMKLPKTQKTKRGMNFVFVGDDAFPLGKHLMKPFPQKGLTREQTIFNYRLSRARRIVENVFGILSARFRIFHTEINLKPENIDKFPKCEDDWKVISKDFDERWNFPNCLGAMDGKHVRIASPPNIGSYFYNYKGSHSLVLLAMFNANYEFVMCHFGTNGTVSDRGVLENTRFCDKLINHELNIPAPSKSKYSELPLAYVFVGDEAFALRDDFLKLFAQKQLNSDRRIFNYRLSRCRRIVENVFGILAARFRIFHTEINLKLESIKKVVLACCALHNFLRRNTATRYSPPECLDNKDLERGEILLGLRAGPNVFVDLQHGQNRNAKTSAKEVSEHFMKYFCNEGRVPWQDKFV